MPRLEVSELVGVAEIAERLGITQPETVYSWRRRHPDFPEPVLRLRMGMIWHWPDVERWARKTGRLT